MRYFQTIFIGFILLNLNCCRHISEPNNLASIDIPGKIDIDLDFALLKPDSTLWTWGTNTTGQLGNGSLMSNNLPTRNTSLQGIISLDLCEGIAIAVNKVGQVWYWGNRITHNNDIVISEPIIISQSHEVKQVDILGETVYLLHYNGTISKLVLDFNDPTKLLIPQKIENYSEVIQISQGIALKSSGIPNTLPDISLDTYNGGLTSKLNNIKNIVHVINGYTIILKNDGTVWSWGHSNVGALGIGEIYNSNIPVRIKELSNVIQISASGQKCMAIDNGGYVWYWGLEYLDLEGGIEKYVNQPVLIEGISQAELICAGGGQELNLVYTKNDEIWGFKSLDKIAFKIY